MGLRRRIRVLRLEAHTTAAAVRSAAIDTCANCGNDVAPDAVHCSSCGAALSSPTKRARGENGERVLGCLAGGCTGYVIAFIVMIVLIPGQQFTRASGPIGTVLLISIALVAVLAVPVLLPYGRRMSVFLRWYMVSTLLIYLGVFYVCSK